MVTALEKGMIGAMSEERTRGVEHPGEHGASLEALLSHWDGEEVIVRFDRPSGSWIVIAIHSSQRGPAGGGTRMKSYPGLAAAVGDAMRLSAAMTSKFTLADSSWGGGKAVLAVPSGLAPQDRRDLLRRYGALVHQLGGLFRTAPDVGTSSSDMDVIAETGAPYIYGRSPEAGGSGDSGPPTALGVFHSIRVVAERVFGSDSLAGKVVLVQGTGHVGMPLVESLVGEGARVLVSDVDGESVRRAQHFGAHPIDPDDVYDTPCDIFAPCALGGILSRETIPRLNCRAIAGAANNQLETAEDAMRLHERGILYAPDFVVNVGAVVAILDIEGSGWSCREAEQHIRDTVTRTLREIFDLAATDDITTTAAAERIVDMRRNATPAP